MPDGTAVFLHRRNPLNGYALQPGSQVTFRVVATERGLRAVEVELDVKQGANA
jgi:cold shock CspA family protein